MTRSERIEAAARAVMDSHPPSMEQWQALRAALASPPAPAEEEREVAAFLAAHDRFNTFARFTIEFASDWDEALAEDEMHHVSRLRALSAPRPPSSPDPGHLTRWQCRACGVVGPWCADEAAMRTTLADHVCPPAPSPDPGERPASRCVCGDREDEHGPDALQRIASPIAGVLNQRCRVKGCGCERFRPHAPRAPSPAAVEAPRRCEHPAERRTQRPGLGLTVCGVCLANLPAQPQTKEGES